MRTRLMSSHKVRYSQLDLTGFITTSPPGALMLLIGNFEQRLLLLPLEIHHSIQLFVASYKFCFTIPIFTE